MRKIVARKEPDNAALQVTKRIYNGLRKRGNKTDPKIMESVLYEFLRRYSAAYAEKKVAEQVRKKNLRRIVCSYSKRSSPNTAKDSL